MPATRATGATSAPIRRARTPIPPATANASGRKPASRRDWESETASENGVKIHGTRQTTRTASAPPTT